MLIFKEANSGWHFIINTEDMKPKDWMDFNKEVEKIRKIDPNFFVDSIPGGNDQVYNISDCLTEWQKLLKKYFPRVKIKNGFYKGRTGAY